MIIIEHVLLCCKYSTSEDFLAFPYIQSCLFLDPPPQIWISSLSLTTPHPIRSHKKSFVSFLPFYLLPYYKIISKY